MPLHVRQGQFWTFRTKDVLQSAEVSPIDCYVGEVGSAVWLRGWSKVLKSGGATDCQRRVDCRLWSFQNRNMRNNSLTALAIERNFLALAPCIAGKLGNSGKCAKSKTVQITGDINSYTLQTITPVVQWFELVTVSGRGEWGSSTTRQGRHTYGMIPVTPFGRSICAAQK